MTYLITWTLLFCPINAISWTAYTRHREFKDEKVAESFMKTRPRQDQIYECTNNLTGEHGYCKVENMWLEVE